MGKKQAWKGRDFHLVLSSMRCNAVSQEASGGIKVQCEAGAHGRCHTTENSRVLPGVRMGVGSSHMDDNTQGEVMEKGEGRRTLGKDGGGEIL